jgi:hypothetical protein
MSSITGTLKSSTGMNISTGPPMRDDVIPEPVEVGTPIVAVPFEAWPPVDPQPNTLYLRLAS